MTIVSMSPSLVNEFMMFPEYQFWFDAILKNNATEMEKTLSNATEDMAKLLINGKFEFQQMHSETHPLAKQIAKCFHVNRPLQIAAVYGKQHAFNALIKHGGNISVLDEYKNNILHLICYGINGNPDREEDARIFYRWLVDNISKDQIMQLLSEKNCNNLNAETTAVA